MCRICKSKEKTRNIDLYVFGSEGLNACHNCEMILVEFVRSLSLVGARAYKEAVKEKIKAN